MHFSTRIIARKECDESPIVFINYTSFIFINHKDIILLAATKANANVALIIYFLYSLIPIFNGYIGEFNEDNIHKNVVLMYELLDEVIDFGIP